jgi:hypothetical protein
MSEDPFQLSEEMIAAINRVAYRMGVSPVSVLKRAIFTYTGKFDRPMQQADATNVVSLRRADQESGE